ncbi:MAG: hypothetical protein PHX51_08290 [Clostridia bacterium]|nr:hypothetical protein [Clostridia bacterium]
MNERASKAICFMLRNETYDYDKKPHKPINEGDGKEYTWLGLTKEDDEKYLPSPYKTLWDLYELSKTNLSKAVEIAIQVYTKGYWNPNYDKLVNERLAIRLFDLGVNMGVGTSVKLLQRALNDCGAKLTVDGVFGASTIDAANKYSLDDAGKLNDLFKNHASIFCKIAEKALELFQDFVRFDFAEFGRDIADIKAYASELIGYAVDDSVLKEFVLEAKDRYESIAQKPKFSRFLSGWMNRLRKDELNTK